MLLVPVLSIAEEPKVFPGTTPWEHRGDPAKDMVDGLHRYFDARTKELIAGRAGFWKRDDSSSQAYEASIAPQREHLRRIIGSVRVAPTKVSMEVIAATDGNGVLAESKHWKARRVRWSVYSDFQAEGLLLEPNGPPVAAVVALPDCDRTPEQFAGIAPGLSRNEQLARNLADRGYRVLVPTLLDRSDEFSGNAAVRMTNLSHREWIYRMAIEVARHPIGYEVDEVRAATDWLVDTSPKGTPLGIVGQGEGGLVGLFASALDPRIGATWIGGFFGPREGTWSEPIDRNVWGFLSEFGSAELASMVAPRGLIVEACRGPETSGPLAPVNGRSDAASGKLTTPKLVEVRAEFKRLLTLIGKVDPARLVLLPTADGRGESNEAGRGVAAFSGLLGLDSTSTVGSDSGVDVKGSTDPRERQGRLVRALSDHTQSLVRTSELRRNSYWSQAALTSADAWEKSTSTYRDRFSKDLIGELPPPTLPPAPQSVKLFEEPGWTAYGIKLDLWQDVVASGVLLWPKDIKPGERRPVVVCQHGLEGTPEPLVDRKIKSVYNSYAAHLADRGYIVYAPQNPYIGVDRFRQLQRKANPIGASLFSVIVRQHELTLKWLASLGGVDPKRIAFYGLSYGGKTAMRVPAILPGYCLSICSADFNEWVVKTTNIDRAYSYLYTIEYDMYEFGLAESSNYAEMAGLIAPRPFMVERGHHDGVAPDEWIGYEFAKVRRLYDLLGIGDRAEIAYFNRGHEIDGKGTFAFLAKHLDWPRGKLPMSH